MSIKIRVMDLEDRVDDIEDNSLDPLLHLKPYVPINECGSVNVVSSIFAVPEYVSPSGSDPYYAGVRVEYKVDSFRNVEYHFDINYTYESESGRLHIEIYYEGDGWTVRNPQTPFTYEVVIPDAKTIGVGITGDATWDRGGPTVAILSTGVQLQSIVDLNDKIDELQTDPTFNSLTISEADNENIITFGSDIDIARIGYLPVKAIWDPTVEYQALTFGDVWDDYVQIAQGYGSLFLRPVYIVGQEASACFAVNGSYFSIGCGQVPGAEDVIISYDIDTSVLDIYNTTQFASGLRVSQSIMFGDSENELGRINMVQDEMRFSIAGGADGLILRESETIIPSTFTLFAKAIYTWGGSDWTTWADDELVTAGQVKSVLNVLLSRITALETQ
jgi:hypothetical protein